VTVGAVLTAAGSGRRFGAPVPKALVPLAGRALVVHAALALEHTAAVQQLVVTAPQAHLPAIESAVSAACSIPVTVVAGGPTRQASVAAGLKALSGCEVVLVHDAARPLASVGLMQELIDQVQQGHDAVVPGVPVTDTVKEVDDAHPPRAVRTVERTSLRAIQTPQAFRSETLRRAHAAGAQLAGQEASAISDDAGLAERCGITVRVIEGEPRAMKITTPHDLALAELFATEER